MTRAMDVVNQLSDALGLALKEPSLLKDSNHVTFRVNADVVARVLLDAGDNAYAMLALGRDVSHYLAEHGAPVTRPTTRPDAGPHQVDGHCVTFWCYEPIAASRVDVNQAASALKHVHRELRDFPGELPHFWDSMETTYQSLLSPAGRQFLSVQDHGFLVDVFDQFQHLRSLSKDVLRPLHGGCHLANVINTERGHLWLDFDSVCEGPIEWDLTCFAGDVSGDRNFDAELLHELGLLRSWATSVWCWMIYDRSEEKREAADLHLARLKMQYPKNSGENHALHINPGSRCARSG